MADGFAGQGFVVMLPDLFNGDPIPDGLPPDFDVPAWMQRHQVSDIEPIIEGIINHMRSKLGCEKIAGIGYCLGVSSESTGSVDGRTPGC
jgi:dienelactone hydrolase